ncbi:uncharacterized protein [Pseudochaenichthys georgianus]|uniref:uncharacterized protein isoform X2 n=1 Tax=Pseudochaenichthys georgianus TaxID=52239 RepID=UPI0039C06BD1
MDRFDCQYLMATFVNVYIASFIRPRCVCIRSRSTASLSPPSTPSWDPSEDSLPAASREPSRSKILPTRSRVTVALWTGSTASTSWSHLLTSTTTIASFIRGPNPSKVIQQLLMLRIDQQLHIFNSLKAHLTEKGFLPALEDVMQIPPSP